MTIKFYCNKQCGLGLQSPTPPPKILMGVNSFDMLIKSTFRQDRCILKSDKTINGKNAIDDARETAWNAVNSAQQTVAQAFNLKVA